MATIEADLGILMPKISDVERFTNRYEGLADALALAGLRTVFLNGHQTYDSNERSITEPIDKDFSVVRETAAVPLIRDLTMAPKAKPLYAPDTGLSIVHHPDANSFLENKANVYDALPNLHPFTMRANKSTVHDAVSEIQGERVVIKPVVGMASQGVRVVSKQSAGQLELEDGDYLVQEFIDTSHGIPSLAVEGMHNIQMLSIDNVVVGAIARVGGKRSNILENDTWGNFIDNDDLPDTMHAIADKVHGVMADLPGNGRNIIAIDVMRGQRADGEQVDVLCEVNRRPMRISKWDLVAGMHHDDTAVREMARIWDKQEAELLAGISGDMT